LLTISSTRHRATDPATVTVPVEDQIRAFIAELEAKRRNDDE